jgi:trimeric autotransporter adhesin
MDAQPLAGNANTQIGTVYYRLKMTDRNGTSRYSNIEKLNFGKGVEGIVVSPNPFEKQFTISIMAQTHSLLQLQLSDATGKVYWQKTTKLVPGNNTITEKPEREMAPGIYLLKCTGEGINRVMRLVKE